MEFALKDIMDQEDSSWLSSVTSTSNVKWLQEQLTLETNTDRKAIIKARIQNINPLVI